MTTTPTTPAQRLPEALRPIAQASSPRLLVWLEPGHGPQPRGYDPGAVREDLGIDEHTEAIAYAHTLRGELEDLGIDALVHDVHLPPGYGVRHQAVIARAQASPASFILYVQCHLNSTRDRTTDYPLVMIDLRSRTGAAVADAIQGAYAASRLPYCRIVGMSAGDRGHVCIGGIYDGPNNCAAILLEPGFLSARTYRRSLLLPRLQGIAQGIQAWWEARQQPRSA